MSIEANKAVVRRWFAEFWNAGRLDVADELYHPEYRSGDEEPGAASVASSRAGVAYWRSVMPDITFTLDEVIGEGDTVVARWTGVGRVTGAWDTEIGRAPTSERVTRTEGVSAFHFRDGTIVRDLSVIDFLHLLGQLGARLEGSE